MQKRHPIVDAETEAILRETSFDMKQGSCNHPDTRMSPIGTTRKQPMARMKMRTYRVYQCVVCGSRIEIVDSNKGHGRCNGYAYIGGEK